MISLHVTLNVGVFQRQFRMIVGKYFNSSKTSTFIVPYAGTVLQFSIVSTTEWQSVLIGDSRSKCSIYKINVDGVTFNTYTDFPPLHQILLAF